VSFAQKSEQSQASNVTKIVLILFWLKFFTNLIFKHENWILTQNKPKN